MISSRPPVKIRRLYTAAPVELSDQPLIGKPGVVPNEPIPGPAVPVTQRTVWYQGEGPPGLVPGAKAGDCYLDTLTSDVYRLEA